MEELIARLADIFNGNEEELAKFTESPADYIEANAADIAAEDIDPLQVLTEALAASELDTDTQAQVMEAYQTAATPYDVPAETGYAPHQLADVFAQSLNATLEEGDYINVDNSLYADGGQEAPYAQEPKPYSEEPKPYGEEPKPYSEEPKPYGEEPKPVYGDDGAEIKGGIDQSNTTNITNADDGAVIADYANDSNFQTGSDNLQVDGGWVENVTSGDGNVVASGASVIGDGNVNAGTINNSEFGEGNQDRSLDVDVDIKDSFSDDDYVSKDYSDDDTYKTDVDVDVALKDGHDHGHGYEGVEQVAGYDAGAEALESIADDLLE